MSTSKKFISATLSLTTTVWLSGVLMLAPVAQAQTTADLQAQIAALLAQIQQLQSQLNSGNNTVSLACSFTRDLTVGSSGQDVKCLQQFLNGHGVLVSGSGAGSPGNETTYFGALTKAAVAQWQGSNGITPAVGYFGPKSRAAYSAMAGTTTPPGTPPPPGSPLPIPGVGLSVSLASDNPAPGALISSSGSSAARVAVLAINLTAGSAGGVTVNDLKFKKLGAFSDSNISSAYLMENGKVLTQYSSLSGGVLTFSGINLGVNAGQTRKLWLAIDPATGLTAGNTVSFALNAASDVAATDNNNAAVTATGSFPMNGNIFTITSVSNPSIAALTVASSSVGNSVYAGTTGVLVSQWTLTASNSPVKLGSINFKVIGSANKSDLKNVKLFLNGTQVGPTLAQVNSDGSAYFDLTSNAPTVNTGNSNLQVYADVMGSPSYNFQFEILNGYDVLAIDTQYNTPVSITVNGGTGIQVTINQGSITVSLASNTPTGNVSRGGSGVTLAKFTIYAAGEPVKVKWLGFSLVFGSGAGATLDNEIKNVNIIDDAGNQLGTTINSMVTAVTCTDTVQTTATTTASNCFGNSSSPINYVVPANTTRVLSLRGDLQSGSTAATIQAKLTGNTSNLQGQTSSQTASSGSVNGATLTESSSAVTVSKNSAIGDQTVSKGQLGATVGSFTLTASSAEGANLTSINITMGNGDKLQNVKLMVGSSQLGNTQTTVGASSTYTFSGSLNIPAGQTKTLDVVADILSGVTAGTYTTVTTLAACSGSGVSTFTSITCSSTAGQNMVVAGQASIQVSADSVPAAAQYVMGSTNNNLATFRFTETSNIEDVRVTDLNVFDQVAGTNTVKAAIGSLSLYNGATLLGTAGSPATAASTSNPGSGYIYAFHFASPVVVPKGNSIGLALKGDVASYGSSGASDNTTHVFKIATSTDSTNDTLPETVVALGNTSNATSSVTLIGASNQATANAATVVRTKVAVAGATLSTVTGRGKTSVDNLATISFTADSAGSAVINSIVVTFSGSAPSSTFLDAVTLLDESNNSMPLSGAGTANTTSATACNGSNSCTKTFNLAVTNGGAGGTIVGAGQTRTFTLRVDSTKTQAGASGISQTLTAIINASTDVGYTDGLDGGATRLSLPTNVVPLTIASVTYAAGQ